MAHPKAAWGMEIGAYAIKAIRLEREGDSVKVTDFAVIPHKKVLTTPDLDKDEMVRLSLGQFISQKALEGEHLVMSVPGHAAFARFAKLPPVEPKKVPDIVKFEAVQQIPFPIDQVEWDYQTFVTEGSPEIEVGIFAITRERVQQRLSLYYELGIVPELLTLSPVAVFNSMSFDHDLAGSKKTLVFIDIGTSATDMIVVDQNRCWIRTFPLGGTHFTEAIANSFKLSYSKAEKLKHEASSSKYAKQIMQAMRPVFSDLLQDIQRSIGYYQSLHREADLTNVIGIGSTFKIPGLRKFLGQQLQVNVARLDEYKKIAVTGREAAAFAENAVNMATAYGLALQGVGLAPIEANLMPVKLLRDSMWHGKTKWFAAAAAIVVAGAAMTLYRPITDRAALHSGGAPPEVANAIQTGEQLKAQAQQAFAETQVGAMGVNYKRLTDERQVWMHLVADASAALNATKPREVLIGTDLEAIRSVPPTEREFIQLVNLSGDYVPPADKSAKGRRMNVSLLAEFSHAGKSDFINSTVAKWLRENAERPGVPYRILTETVAVNPPMMATFEVDAEGNVKAVGGPTGSTQQPGNMLPPPPTDVVSPPGDGAGPGPGGFGPGKGPGRRTTTGKYTAPSAGSAGAPGAAAPTGPVSVPPPSSLPTGIGAPPSRGGSMGSESGASGSKPGEVQAMAPLPSLPTLYPPNSKFYRLPITFTVELVDPAAGKAAKAVTPADPEESPS